MRPRRPVFLLFLCCWPAAFTEPVPADRSLHAKRLELCQFVLRRDDQWRLVLEQQVKLTADNRPPYQDDAMDLETRRHLRLVADNADAVTPLTVMQKAVSEFSWLGSHVKYAVQVLREAFTCVAFVHLTHVVRLLEKLESKHEEETVKTEKEGQSSEKAPVHGSGNQTVDGVVTPFQVSFREAWSMVTVLASKLAVVNGELDVVNDLSSVVDNARVSKKAVSFTIFKLMRRKFEDTVDSSCDRPFPVEVYTDFGSKDPIDESSTTSELELYIGRFSRKLITFYGSLGIEIMALRNWAQVFNNQLPNLINVKLDAMMEQILDQDRNMRETVDILNQKFKIQMFENYVSGKFQTGGVTTKSRNSDEDDDRILKFDI